MASTGLINGCRVLPACLAAWIWAAGSLAVADTFRLENGGALSGQLVNRDRRADDPYIIDIASLGRVTVAAARVAQAAVLAPEEREYLDLAPTIDDTVDGHWKMADWCRRHMLDARRKLHLERILVLDPNHTDAHYALGYRQIRGQWMTHEQYRASQGYQVYRGRWRLAQEIELLEQNDKKEIAEREWMGRIKRWREDLSTDRAEAARQQLLAIRDPFAVRGLTQRLEREPYQAVKLLYIEALRDIPSPSAVKTLLSVTLNDPDLEVFHAALDAVVARQRPDVVPVYVEALANGNNLRVNRAAYALGRLEDPSIRPALIDALITTHTQVLPGEPGLTPDSIKSTFGKADSAGAASPGAPFQGTGLSTGDGSTMQSVQIPNQEVLNALVKLSGGVSFGFDKKAWTHWLHSETSAPPTADTRRDQGNR